MEQLELDDCARRPFLKKSAWILPCLVFGVELIFRCLKLPFEIFYDENAHYYLFICKSSGAKEPGQQCAIKSELQISLQVRFDRFLDQLLNLYISRRVFLVQSNPVLAHFADPLVSSPHPLHQLSGTSCVTAQ